MPIHPRQTRTGRPRRTIAALSAVAALAAAGALAYTGLAAADTDPEAAEPAPAVEPAPYGGHVVGPERASELPGSYKVTPRSPEVSPVTAWLEAPTTPQDTAYRNVSRGTAQDELSNVMDEYDREHWRQEGVPRMVGPLTAAPLDIGGHQGARVSVCLNSSSVRIMGEHGRVVRPEQQGRKVMHTFDLVREDSAWHVVATGFPSDPRC